MRAAESVEDGCTDRRTISHIPRSTKSGCGIDHRFASRSKDRKSWLIDPFKPISLDHLNVRSAMLERLDNKYVVKAPVLQAAVGQLADRFDILEIDGNRNFLYETCYFDDINHTSYFDHHQGRRQRYKIRVRKYTDTQSCFIEIKLKDKRGITVKKRLNHSIEKYATLDADALTHIQSAYGEHYGRQINLVLQPVLEIRYERVTLAAKDGGERMTIDSGLAFAGGNRSHRINQDIFIVETKSGNGNGFADKILRGLHQHPTSHCSKYCIAAVVLRLVEKHNNFLPVLRKVLAASDIEQPIGFASGQESDLDRNFGANPHPHMEADHAR